MTVFNSTIAQENAYLEHAEIDLALQRIIDEQPEGLIRDRLINMQIDNVGLARSRMKETGSGVTFETLAHAFAEYTQHRLSVRSALADSLKDNDNA